MHSLQMLSIWCHVDSSNSVDELPQQHSKNSCWVLKQCRIRWRSQDQVASDSSDMHV